jgi:alkanesulfonate monooxygenase SsuD/methylene tetrahydromethanopterin reductase-like flavin-dependent oxidoreductase (luciferase family)
MRRAARRADDWLPVVRPGSQRWEFSPAAVNGPVSEVRRLAAEEGRDPSRLGIILRVYPTEDASIEQVAAAIAGAERETTVDHAFVDVMEIAKDIDQALEVVGRVLELSRGR